MLPGFRRVLLACDGLQILVCYALPYSHWRKLSSSHGSCLGYGPWTSEAWSASSQGQFPATLGQNPLYLRSRLGGPNIKA